MFDSDVSRFDQVFAQSAQLHGLRDGHCLNDDWLITAKSFHVERQYETPTG